MLYVGVPVGLASNARTSTYVRFVEEAPDAGVRAQFTAGAHVYRVAPSEGCGCEFNAEGVNPTTYEEIETLTELWTHAGEDDRKLIVRACHLRGELREWIETHHLQMRVELYYCWMEEEGIPHSRFETLVLAQMTVPTALFKTGVHYTVLELPAQK